MDLIIADKVSFSYGSNEIFSNVSLTITDSTRLALVGRNGLGKTTLLRVLAGELEPTSGEIFRKKGLKIAFLKQEERLEGEDKLLDAVLSQDARWWKLYKTLSSFDNDGENMDNLMAEFQALGGFARESRAKEILGKLGFKEEHFEKPVNLLSGGEKNRAAIAAMLVLEPDIMFFDEPTNHIDYDGLVWLAGFLRNLKKPFVLVSHDRFFLDLVADRVAELYEGKLRIFVGNYSGFEKQKRELIEKQEKQYKHQQQLIKKTEEFIRKNIAGQRTKQAQSRIKMLQRLERIKEPIYDKGFRIKLDIKRRSGDKVLEIKNLSYAYDGNKLFSGFSAVVGRGDKIGVVGRNGCGKTTLLKLISGRLPLIEGEIKLGAGVVVGYYAQDFDDLDDDSTPLEEIQKLAPQMTYEEAMSYLGAFSISGDDAKRLIKTFSGGERSRVALAKLSLVGANFLLLDEPTNHLDINSRKIIEDALKKFEGTVIVVSHDRFFLDAVAQKIWAFENGTIREYYGNFSYYLSKRLQRQTLRRKVNVKKTEPRETSEKQLKNKLRKLKTTIMELEKQIEELEKERERILSLMGQPFVVKDPQRIKSVSQQFELIETELKSLWSMWEQNSVELEEIMDILGVEEQ